MSRVLVLTIFLIVTFEAKAQANAHACYSGEIEVVSCTVRHNKKLLSICGGRDRSYVFYRFRKREKLELEVEFSAANQIVRWVQPRNLVTFFSFDRGGYSYTVGVPQETFGARAYYFVRRVGEPIDFNAPIYCTSNSLGDKNWRSDAIADLDSASLEDEKRVCGEQGC
jgi:hypothetical protein